MKSLLLICLLTLSFSANAGTLSPEWLALGHYRPNIFGGYEASIDSDNFYLAEDGRTNPQAELEATVKLFNEQKDKEKICLFQGRYLFLKKQGLIEENKIRCEEFEQFKKDLQPQGVTLLFTDAYMNNPSSLFGHTLLRIDTARKGTQLLAHGANYGAFTDGKENGALFAIYGLTGGYYGGWTVKPYYDIINTYNNIENRDIWELNLNFSEEELDMFVAHLWEIGHTQTRYYFFTKNCSYMIMEMLDAVRPSLRLADEFWLQTIPLDTVKAVNRRPNLVKNVNYRPSRQSKIIHRAKQMNEAQEKAYLAAIKDKNYNLENLPDEQKADVLETAYQYVQYQFVKKEYDLQEYRKRSFMGLMARNRLQNQKAVMSENPDGKSPLDAHESKRITFGVGSKGGESFQEFSIRPAYHSLTDNNYGLLPGAEINFLNLKIRHYDNSHKTVLEQFNLLGIKSLSPINEMFHPISFNMGMDIARETRPDNQKEGYVLNGWVGGGAAYKPTDFLSLYFMNNLYGSYGGFLPHNQYVGIGFTGGAFVDFYRIKLLAEAEKIFASSWYGSQIRYKLEANLVLTTNWSLAAEYKYNDRQKGDDEEEFTTSVRHYF